MAERDPSDPGVDRGLARLGAPAWSPGQPLDHVSLRALVSEQNGLVTARQLRAAGVSSKVTTSRIRQERWWSPYPDVYLTTPGRTDPMTRLIGAVLAVGDPVAVSHGSAAFLHGLTRELAGPIHVSVPHERRIEVAGLVVHRSRRHDDLVDPLAWPWRTTAAHTVIDQASTVSRADGLGSVMRACALGVVTPESLQAALERRGPVRWGVAMRRLLLEVLDGAESELERRCLRDVLRPHGLPAGDGQTHSVAGRHDRGFPEHRVLLELDGRVGHAGWAAQQRDAQRDRRAIAEGWVVVRAHWRDVVSRPCGLARELAAILMRRGWTGEPRACRRPGCGVSGRAAYPWGA